MAIPGISLKTHGTSLQCVGLVKVLRNLTDAIETAYIWKAHDVDGICDISWYDT
jgi:hypothetical protein